MRTVFWVTAASLVTSALLTVAVADFIHRRNHAQSPPSQGSAVQAATTQPASPCPVVLDLQGEPMPSRSAELAALAGLPETYFAEDETNSTREQWKEDDRMWRNGAEVLGHRPVPVEEEEYEGGGDYTYTFGEDSFFMHNRWTGEVTECLPCHPVPVNVADKVDGGELIGVDPDQLDNVTLGFRQTKTKFDCCEACPLTAAYCWMSQLCGAFVCGVSKPAEGIVPRITVVDDFTPDPGSDPEAVKLERFLKKIDVDPKRPAWRDGAEVLPCCPVPVEQAVEPDEFEGPPILRKLPFHPAPLRYEPLPCHPVPVKQPVQPYDFEGLVILDGPCIPYIPRREALPCHPVPVEQPAELDEFEGPPILKKLPFNPARPRHEVLPCCPVPVEEEHKGIVPRITVIDDGSGVDDDVCDAYKFQDLIKEIVEGRTSIADLARRQSACLEVDRPRITYGSVSTRSKFDCCEACPLMAACRWMNELCEAFACDVTEGRCCYEISECPKACRVAELAKECACHEACKCGTRCSCAKNQSGCSKLCSCAKPAEKLVRRVYPIGDITLGKDEAGDLTSVVKPQTVIWLIESAVAPDSWERSGGIGRIEYWPVGNTLVIVHNAEVHERIAAFLDRFRNHQDGPGVKADAFPGCEQCPAGCPRIIREVCPRSCERIGVEFKVEVDRDPGLIPGKLPSSTAPEDMSEASAALLKDFDRLFADGMYADALLVAKLAHQLDPLNGKALACTRLAREMCELADPPVGGYLPHEPYRPRRSEPPTPEQLPVCEPEHCPYRGSPHYQGSPRYTAPVPKQKTIEFEVLPVAPVEVTAEAALEEFLIRILASPGFVDAGRSPRTLTQDEFDNLITTSSFAPGGFVPDPPPLPRAVPERR